MQAQHNICVVLLQNTGATTGLPPWWGFYEDHVLLLEADEKGYYPNSRNRGSLAEGFIAEFLQSRCKGHCRVSSAEALRCLPCDTAAPFPFACWLVMPAFTDI